MSVKDSQPGGLNYVTDKWFVKGPPRYEHHIRQLAKQIVFQLHFIFRRYPLGLTFVTVVAEPTVVCLSVLTESPSRCFVTISQNAKHIYQEELSSPVFFSLSSTPAARPFEGPGRSWLNSGQKASVTRQHLLLLLSFLPACRGTCSLSRGWPFVWPPLSIPSLSADNAAGL